MRRLIRSRLIWIPLFANVCPILHDVQRYLTLPFSFIPGIYLTIIMAMSAMSVMFSVFVILFFSGIYFTIIMAMSAMSVMFPAFVIIISFQVFTLP